MKNAFVVSVCLMWLAACGGSSAPEAAAPDPVATVRTAVATAANTSDSVTVFGLVEPTPGAEHALTPQMDATVARIVAPEGTAVRAGDVVAVLAPTPTATVEATKARADAAAAEAALARAQRLRADGLASNADVETARVAASSARATLTGMSVRNGGLTLRAPVSGRVQNLTARVGDQVTAGTALTSVVGDGAARARLGADPQVASRIIPGAQVQIAATSSGAVIDTTISGVSPQPDATTHLVALFAALPAGAQFAAGEPLRATVHVGAAAAGVSVPYAALLDDGGRSYVFVVSNGVAHRRDVVPGTSATDTVAIQSGLRAGERVVTEGGTALEDGMKVRETPTVAGTR